MCAFLIVLVAGRSEAQQAPANMITTKERAFAVQFLKETRSHVFSSVKGLSEAQLSFKADPDKWSVAECVKHIAAAEKELWAMAQPALEQPVNPEKRTAIKFNDAQLIAAVKDRTHKSKTFAALEPANSPYQTVQEALEAFQQNREKLIAFVRNTKADLRNHVLVLPVGNYDTYQFILLIAAHSDRHLQQIEEVKSDVSFPKEQK